MLLSHSIPSGCFKRTYGCESGCCCICVLFLCTLRTTLFIVWRYREVTCKVSYFATELFLLIFYPIFDRLNRLQKLEFYIIIFVSYGKVRFLYFYVHYHLVTTKKAFSTSPVATVVWIVGLQKWKRNCILNVLTNRHASYYLRHLDGVQNGIGLITELLQLAPFLLCLIFFWILTFMFACQVFEGNVDSYGVKHSYLDSPIIARFIKFHTVHWHRHPSMRVEVFGCQCNTAFLNTSQPIIIISVQK